MTQGHESVWRDAWLESVLGETAAPVAPGKRTLTAPIQCKQAERLDGTTNYHGLVMSFGPRAAHAGAPIGTGASSGQSFVDSILGAPVQRADQPGTERPDAPQIAAMGLSGPATPLPYADQIQASFGRHSVAGVKAYVGGPAAEASAAIGASAYATGDSVAFARAPDLHTAAHEAAHVIQQRSGVHLRGGMGEAGDVHERHADAVADAVVRGASAEALLDQYGGGGGRAGVQCRSSDEVPAPLAGDGGGPSESAGPGGEDDAVELSAEPAGEKEIEGTEPIAPPHDLEAGLAGFGAMRAEKAGGPGASGDDGAPGAPSSADPARNDADAAQGGPMSPALAAAIEGAQQDARQASAQAESDGGAFNVEMSARRDRFMAEQTALTLERLETMSPADKRRTLVEMGMPEKEVKKLKDAELDGLITGKLDAENRKAIINGMTPEELGGLSPDRKIQHLADLGIDRADLDKAGRDKASKAFDDVMRLSKIPGKHEVKIKVKGGLFGKSWVLAINVDAEGEAEIEAKKQGGFFSKLLGWVKAALPVILTVLAPITGGASLIVLAVYQTVMAIKTGDWLGAIVGVAGALTGVGAIVAARGATVASSTLLKVAAVAEKVKTAARTAQAALMAAKARNPGSLLGALAAGAATFAAAAAKTASAFAAKMTSWAERLKKWAGVITGAQKVVAGIKAGDPLGAIGGAFESASAAVGGTSRTGKALASATKITSFVGAGKRALAASPPDYGAVVDAALGIAAELTQNKDVDGARKIVSAANRLQAAWAQRDSNPAALVQAALDLAQAIQVAKYDLEHDDKTDADGNPIADPERQAVLDRYTKANAIAKGASAIIQAASARPRPNYAAALAAASQMIADLTDNEQLDAAAVVAARLDAWTAAINSKDERAIMAAGIALGQSINSLREVIEAERERARQEAEARLAPGERLPEAGDTSIPPFEGGAGGAPEGTVTTDEAFWLDLGPRDNTPGANYAVIPGDTLSGIGSRFGATISVLRARNPQLVGDTIYAGQRIFVPGAGTPVDGTVTTEESFRVDPAAERRALAVGSARQVIDTVRAQIGAWNEHDHLGADFYVYVRELGEQADGLERLIGDASSSVDDISSRITDLNERFVRVRQLFDVRNGQNTALIDVGIVAATMVRGAAGAVLGVLDKSRISPALYAGVVTAIDEYSRGGSARTIALRSAIAAALKFVPGSEGALNRSLTEGFREAGLALNDMLADLSRDPDLTDAEKQAIFDKYIVKIPSMFAMGVVKGQLDQMNKAAEAAQVKELMDRTLLQMYKDVFSLVV